MTHQASSDQMAEIFGDVCYGDADRFSLHYIVNWHDWLM